MKRLLPLLVILTALGCKSSTAPETFTVTVTMPATCASGNRLFIDGKDSGSFGSSITVNVSSGNHFFAVERNGTKIGIDTHYYGTDVSNNMNLAGRCS